MDHLHKRVNFHVNKTLTSVLFRYIFAQRVLVGLTMFRANKYIRVFCENSTIKVHSNLHSVASHTQNRKLKSSKRLIN